MVININLLSIRSTEPITNSDIVDLNIIKVYAYGIIGLYLIKSMYSL